MASDKSQQVLQLYPGLPLTLTMVGSGRPVLVVHEVFARIDAFLAA